ncbi:hypermethylated in cancer 1 protein isoform X1 [Micropterus salmoides]|uniref:hypermethylated in cancer 1 protein isoform X1 n=2 Tax=Micropterus salmoides TaxID=27706 RepID=UPI0018ED7AAF|nr:hypermethylated in cancer 1 protein isoform X1 [Micropterus salmoides]XP_045929372.1 hypermethylated in cancer 1 protein isoform X1 [Micropterus dolomieu]
MRECRKGERTYGQNTRHESEISVVSGGGLKTMLDAMEVPSHARDLLLQLNSQRTKGFLCDVIIVVQNALFRAHKNILAASSLYLKSLVVHDNLINLDHEMVSPGVFRVILDYIYTGRLNEGDPTSPTEPNLGAVLAAASYLQLLDLVALCKKKLKRNGKYPPRPGPAFLPYPKMGPNSMGLGSGGRYRVSTPVIQSCPPGGILNSHATRAPPLEELVPHRLALHAGELYAPTSTQGSQVFPSLQSALPAQLGRTAHTERNCSPNYGLDLSKKSPNSQSQHTPSNSLLANNHNDEERDGNLSARTSPMQGANGRPFPLEKMELTDQGSSLTPPPFPHLNQSLGPHLPHMHRSGSQSTDRYPCPPSPDTPTEGGEGGREMGNIYRWVKHEPFTAEDEDEDDDEEEGGENGDQHHNHHKAGEESEGADDKSGSGTEETGSSEGRPSPPGPMGRFHMPYEPESFGDNLYVCIPCDKGFPSSEQLNAHVETHTEEELYGNSGGEMGNSNNSSTKNMSSNTNGYGSLNSSNSLNSLSHLETKSSQGLGSGGIGEMMRPYRCSSCEKSYKDPATLRQHEKTHWLTRPYPCSICGKKFTQRGTMTRHMRSHLGLKPFACDSCGMRFTRQYRLTEHMRIHSGEKPYECQVCGGKFAQQRNLISHMKMHSSGGTAGGLTTDGKLKLDFAEGIYPLSKYAAEHLGLKQEKANELLIQAQQQLVADAKAIESLYPLSKLASEHLGLTHDKMDVLGQPLPPPPQALSEARTIDRYSPS